MKQLKNTATLSFALCNSSDSTDGSMVLANWWPTDDDFMYERILHRTLHASDCRFASSSDYTQTVAIAESPFIAIIFVFIFLTFDS